ncbi:hypothetical protein DXG03_005951 [Asterophora parasitica]|uniref:Uncharacterized protein n=1 Tax=Asterophora parasitica TaxID=117018 RepID=A0A9P7FZG5_9AGAR|nr:hypothetical protein DXG03_005951 [Asterophora parasitica]
MDSPPAYSDSTLAHSTLTPTIKEKSASKAPASTSEQPPSYTDTDTFPTSFSIGRTRTSRPLVNVAQLKGHLALLRAIVELRAHIEGSVDNLGFGNGNDAESETAGADSFPAPPPLIPSYSGRRWVWFVGLAVERFEKWCQSFQLGAGRDWPPESEKSEKLNEAVATDHLPPLDVLMVWHSYMLSPGWYAEDRTRLPVLQHLGDIERTFASSLGSGFKEMLAAEPTAARRRIWSERTGRPFDVLEDVRTNTSKAVQCPRCLKDVDAPYMTPEGKGYLQRNFTAYCPCAPSAAITKQKLAARKFAADAVRGGGDLEDETPWSAGECLAGTLRTSDTPIDLARGARIKDLILCAWQFATLRPQSDNLKVSEPEWARCVAGSAGYHLERLREALPVSDAKGTGNSGNGNGKGKGKGGKGWGVPEVLKNRIFSAYVDDRPFSVELVGAVIRQNAFAQKMRALGWTESDFDKDGEALKHAIARYHAFLDLMASGSASFCVPTLDIDLAWHTHQLMGEQYNAECMRHVGRFVDHDDKVEEHKLSSSFDLTSHAWESRFGVPYTHCGCPAPNPTLSQRIKSPLKSRLSFSSSSKSNSPHTHPHTHITHTPTHARASTHPSEHNAVVYLANATLKASMDAQRQRNKFIAKEQLSKSKGKSKAKDKRSTDMHGASASRAWHPPAFLTPIPVYSYACAARDGHIEYGDLDGGGAFGACEAVVVPRTTTTRGQSIYVLLGYDEDADCWDLVWTQILLCRVLFTTMGEMEVMEGVVAMEVLGEDVGAVGAAGGVVVAVEAVEANHAVDWRVLYWYSRRSTGFCM